MNMEDLVSKEDGWIYVNSIIVYLALFPLPENITNSSIFILVTFGIFALVYRLSGMENLQKRIFHRQLVESEIRKRRAAPNVTYDDLASKGQEEIDKIDAYFHNHAKNFTGLLILTTTLLALILLQAIDVAPNPVLIVQNYTLEVLYLAIFTAIINILLMYDDYHEIKMYMYRDQKEVYEKYS